MDARPPLKTPYWPIILAVVAKVAIAGVIFKMGWDGEMANKNVYIGMSEEEIIEVLRRQDGHGREVE